MGREVLEAIKEANNFDIFDCNKTILVLEEKKCAFENVLDGEFIINKIKEAQKEADYCCTMKDYYNALCWKSSKNPVESSEIYHNQYERYCGEEDYALREKRRYEEKLARFQEIEDRLCGLFDSGNELRKCAYQGLAGLYDAYDEFGEYTTPNWDWKDDYNKYLKDKENEIIEIFHIKLPEEIRNVITKEDIVCTDDGFCMLKIPVSDILSASGINDTTMDEIDNDVDLFYDDWYIYGVEDENGNYTYGLTKMREPEDDGGDSDKPGVTISFVEFDINKLNEVLPFGDKWSDSDNGKNCMDEFVKKLKVCVENDDAIHSDNLKNYFSRTESKAPYIVADLFIEKLVSMASDEGTIPLPQEFDTATERVKNELNRINDETGKKIYDPENNCIRIEDTNNLNENERHAILAAYTGDLSKNSFAAEVEFHADAIDDPLLKQFAYENSIRADMNCYANLKGNWKVNIKNTIREWFFEDYFDLDDKSVNEQRLMHGNK